MTDADLAPRGCSVASIGRVAAARSGQYAQSFVLVRPSRAQQPHPRCQRGWDIDHRLTGGKELLGEQVAEPACGLDHPDPRTVVQLARPAQQLRDLSRGGPHQPFAQHSLVAVDRDRGVVPLCGSIPIMTIVILRSSSRWDRPQWALLIPDVELLPSSEPHRGGTPAAPHLAIGSQTREPAGSS
jgi:hypothetical protein